MTYFIQKGGNITDAINLCHFIVVSVAQKSMSFAAFLIMTCDIIALPLNTTMGKKSTRAEEPYALDCLPF